jgi:hypothetical protein
MGGVIMRAHAVLLCLAISVCALNVASAASAACYSSTPTTQSFSDSPADGQGGLAPEITAANVQISGACAMTAGPTLANRPDLIDGDAVFVYLDTDGNPATGEQIFGGADHAVGTLGQTGSDSPPLLGTWDPAQGKIVFAGGPTLTAAGAGGFTASLDQLGVAQNVTLGAAIGTMWSGTFNNYFDSAPNVGAPDKAFRFASAYSTQPPTPSAAPQTNSAPSSQGPPQPTQRSTSSTPAAAKSCVVPQVKGKSLAGARRKLRSFDCATTTPRARFSSTVKSGRVIRSVPSARHVAHGSVALYVSKGRRSGTRSRRASAASRGARLDMLQARSRLAWRP